MSETSELSSYETSSRSLSTNSSSSPEPSRSNHEATLMHRVLTELTLTYGRRSVIGLLVEKACPSVGHGTNDPVLHWFMKDYLLWPDVIELLANLGAKATDKNCRGDTALHLAFLNGVTEGRVFNAILENYLENAMENTTNEDGLSFLHIACAKGSADKVKELLEYYPDDINQQVASRKLVPYAGYTPLHFAVEFNRYEIVDLLLKNNSDFCLGDRLGITPLHLALYWSKGADNTDMIDIIDLIFAHDEKNENSMDNFGLSHLMVASAASKRGVVEKILQAALNRYLPPSWMVNRSVTNSAKHPFGGYTPLHFAAQNGNLDTVQLLLRHSASTYALTTDKYTPVALARVNNHNVVLRLLQRYSDGRGKIIPQVHYECIIMIDQINIAYRGYLKTCGLAIEMPIETKAYELF